MGLTPEQLKVIRDATVDEEAFQRVVSLLEDTTQTLSNTVTTSNPRRSKLDSLQLKTISSIIDTLPSVIFVKDLDCRFIMANKACLDMNHCTVEEELLGKNDFDIMSAELAQHNYEIEQELLRTGIPLLDKESCFTNLEGITKWYLESKSPIYDQEGNIVALVGILRDITPQKMAEQSLERERNLLKTIIDHIEDKIYIKDRESRFIVANIATKPSNEVAIEELIGTTDFDHMSREQAQYWFDEEQTIMETGVPITKHETSYPSNITNEGEEWYLISKMPVYDEHGVITGLVGINRNITQQKHYEQYLERERNLLKTIIDHIEDEIYIKDRESRFIIANTATINIHQTTSDDIVGSSDFDYQKPEVAQAFFDQEQRIMETGIPVFRQEISATSKLIEGVDDWYLMSKVPVYDENGIVTGLVGINRNITHQKLAEQSQKYEHELLQTLIDHVQDTIYIKDRESRFIGANAQTLKVHGITLKDLIGTTDFDYMTADFAQMNFDEEQIMMETGQPIINKELFIPPELTDGFPKWHLVSKVPTYDENGEVSGLVGVNHDITTIKLAEQKATQLKLEQERSKILADFITNSSHEFRTPISVINTSAYLLERVNEPEKRQKYVNRITQNTTRLLNLLDSLLLMSRIDRIIEFEKTSFTLESLLHDINDQFQSKLLDNNQTLQLVIDNPNITIDSNRELLIIALSAIVDNAMRYSPDEGEITIRGYRQDDNTIISIQDTGIGMTDEIKKRIFERFYREDEAHSTGGFGLGLPIALRVIELHSGHIEVESQLNKGSRFMIILPQPPATQTL